MRRWHKAHHSDGQGHVYQRPFKPFPIQDDAHFYTVCRYVERNPVRAELVTRAEDWLWGSAWAYSLAGDDRALPLSDWPLPRPDDWISHVNRALTDAEVRDIRQCVERGRPFGSDRWVDDTAKNLDLTYTLRPRGRPPKTT